MIEHARRDVDDPRRRGAQPNREHRHFRVAELERAVAAAADVVAAAQVGELDTGRGRDDQVARVRVRERGPGALERVRLPEDVAVPLVSQPPSLGSKRSSSPSPLRDGTVALAEENDMAELPCRRSASSRASAVQPGRR